MAAGKTLAANEQALAADVNAMLQAGEAASIPATGDVVAGSFYYETDTKILKQEQAGSWVEVAGGEKEFFTPVTVGVEMTIQGYYPVARCNADTDYGRICFHVPANFSSVIEVVGVIIAKATRADANIDLYTQYGTNGELYSAHSENDITSTYNLTNNEIFEIDLSGVLSSLAADDYVGVAIIQKAAEHNFDILGVRFKYI